VTRLVHKTRPRGQANIAEARHIVGDVNGRHCVLIDDMIDTAGTIVAACDLLKAHGAEEIWVMATHAVFSPPAWTDSSTHDQSRHRHRHPAARPERRFENSRSLHRDYRGERDFGDFRGRLGVGHLRRREPALSLGPSREAG